ncbi:hypothetical protein [Cryobacterium mannosilyticum]|uniref:Uncharacterized protein n=1 Tax=Cryobacterium mannosilyticum TaxID=1259190 RepID=A0A4R8WFH1_9MICO|nr:hypothetical protein [Cryobacterium mannosilyticum]TFC07746.1 hypothetical protein E3O32_00970 [Cryobacterium mannosilyticum]
MFNLHWGRAQAGRKSAGKRAVGLGGFTGLEGDFEAERRRAADEQIEPYEQDQIDKPTLPGSSSGLTHP